MRNLILYSLTLGTLLMLSINVKAQKETLKGVSVVEFHPPYEKIIIDYRGVEIPFEVSEKTKIKGEKGSVDSELLTAGVIIQELKYELQGTDRIAQKIETDIDPSGKVKFTGLLESVEGEIAIVDGRRVMLKAGVLPEGSGKKNKCQCDGMVFTGFSDPILQPGQYFLKIEGTETEAGYVIAEEVEACRNVLLDADHKLRNAVENSFTDESLEAGNLSDVIKETNSAMPLYKGQIQIGQYAYQLADDIRLQGYVNMVGERLIPAHQHNLPEGDPNKIFFRFYVIDSKVPNAFAFPNGMIFIHTGLLEVIENEAQLATVLGHEIAHVTHEHGRDRYETTLFTDITTSVVDIGLDLFDFDQMGIDRKAMGFVNDVTSAFTPEVLANVIKPQPERESQADRVGVFYTYQAGYDIRESARLWEKMSELTGDPSFQGKLKNNLQEMLSSPQFSLSNNPLEYLGEAGKNLLMNELLNTIYTSHPKAKQRAHDIGRLLGTYYQEEDFDAFMKGEEAYDQFLGSL